MKNYQLIIIGGPTGTGKTDLAIKIAKQHNGELINADSRQIYKYLDIGTNKGNIIEKEKAFFINDIPIHLINFLEPDKRFSVFEYQKCAKEKIQEILEKKKLPILVGGTGLYIDSIIKNYQMVSEDKISDQVKSKIKKLSRHNLEKYSLKQLQELLNDISQEAFENLNKSDQSNPRRLIRLIEKSNIQKNNTNSKTNKEIYNYLFLYPTYNWDDLKIKLENRVEEMFRKGLVEEAKKVLGMGFPKDSVALRGIGYKQVIEYLDNKFDLPKCIELVKIAHRQYARRQKIWFEGKGRDYKLTLIK